MKLAVASGKGGTGKTTVATNLAVVLADRDRPVQLLDCDAEEPNAHLFLQPLESSKREVESPVPQIDLSKCTLCGDCADFCGYSALAVAKSRVLLFPELCHGCGGCALFCPEKAITETARTIGMVQTSQLGNLELVWGKAEIGLPLVPAVIDEVKQVAKPNATVIIDAPPGTSCAAVAAIADCDLCLLVTEPTAFGLHDLELSVRMTRELDLRCAVIINRADLGDQRVQAFCHEQSIPIVMEIPFSRELAACYARGQLWVQEFPAWKEAFAATWSRIEALL